MFNLKKVFTIHLTPSLPGSILCVCACVAGLSYFTVTTDPIKLWSSTSSVARQQKEYFDKHFSPFFRPTQVLRNNKFLTSYYIAVSFKKIVFKFFQNFDINYGFLLPPQIIIQAPGQPNHEYTVSMKGKKVHLTRKIAFLIDNFIIKSSALITI